MGDIHLEEEVCVTNDLTDEEMRQAKEDVNTINKKAEKVPAKVKKAVKSLNEAADKLDEVWAKHNIAHLLGTVFGIIGGICTIGGGIATLMTAGVASPLLFAGLGFGLTGAGTNIVAKIIESLLNSDEIKTANEDLKEAYDSIAEVKKLIEYRLDEKEKSYLLYMYNVAAGLVSPSLRFLVAYLHSTGIMEVTRETVVKAGQASVQFSEEVGWQATVQGAQAVNKAGAQAAGEAGTQAAAQEAQVVSEASASQAVAQGARAMTKAGVQAMFTTRALAASEAGAQAALKASGQVADDLVQAGVESGGTLAGKVVIGVSAVMIVWDAVDLSFTIYDLVKNKGSEAAKDLREKADELEKQYIKN